MPTPPAAAEQQQPAAARSGGSQLLPWVRLLLWIALAVTNFVIFLLASNSDRVFAERQQQRYYAQTNSTPVQRLECERRVDKIFLYILDSFGYNLLVENANTLPSLQYLLNRIRDNPGRGRFFKMKSTGVLLTNSALYRIFFGKSGSLLESYNNRQNLARSCLISMFYEFNQSGLVTSTFDGDLYRGLFSDKCFGLNLMPFVEHSAITLEKTRALYNGSDFMIVHNFFMDKVMHRFGEGSPRIVEELNGALKVFRQIVEEMDGKSEKVITIITGDHGFSGHNHGTDNDIQSNMPFLTFTNFDGLFDPEKQSNLISQQNQINIPSTFAILLGSKINWASEGNLIPDFFDYVENGEPSTCPYEANSLHLKTILSMRKFYLHMDNSGMSNDLPEYKFNKFLARELSMLPKINSRGLNVLAIINFTHVLFAAGGQSLLTLFSCIFLMGLSFLYIYKLWVLFITFFVVCCFLFCVILYYEGGYRQKRSESIFCNVSPLMPLRALVFIGNFTFTVPMLMHINRFLSYIVWFVIPGLASAGFFEIPSKRRFLLMVNYILGTLVIAVAFQFTSCKQTFSRQLCYNTIYTDKQYFTIATISLLIFNLYAFSKYRPFGPLTTLVALFVISTIIVTVWVLRDLKTISQFNRFQTFVSSFIVILHLASLLLMSIAFVLSIWYREYSHFYNVSILCIIIMCLISYETKFAPIFLITAVVCRSLVEALLILFVVEKRPRKVYDKLIIKVIFFMLFLVYKQVSFHFFYLFGRDVSLQKIYNMKMSFQIAFDNFSHWYTISYGILTTFTPRIFVGILISPIILHFRDYLNVSGRKPVASLKHFFEPFVESYYIWHASLLIGIYLPLTYQNSNSPQHSWNESELYYVLELFDLFWDAFFTILFSLVYQLLPASKSITAKMIPKQRLKHLRNL